MISLVGPSRILLGGPGELHFGPLRFTPGMLRKSATHLKFWTPLSDEVLDIF
jgi:hypothetical protein